MNNAINTDCLIREIISNHNWNDIFIRISAFLKNSSWNMISVNSVKSSQKQLESQNFPDISQKITGKYDGRMSTWHLVVWEWLFILPYLSGIAAASQSHAARCLSIHIWHTAAYRSETVLPRGNQRQISTINTDVKYATHCLICHTIVYTYIYKLINEYLVR